MVAALKAARDRAAMVSHIVHFKASICFRLSNFGRREFWLSELPYSFLEFQILAIAIVPCIQAYLGSNLMASCKA